MPAQTEVGRKRKQPPYYTPIQEEENSNNHNKEEDGIVEKMKKDMICSRITKLITLGRNGATFVII